MTFREFLDLLSASKLSILTTPEPAVETTTTQLLATIISHGANSIFQLPTLPALVHSSLDSRSVPLLDSIVVALAKRVKLYMYVVATSLEANHS